MQDRALERTQNSATTLFGKTNFLGIQKISETEIEMGVCHAPRNEEKDAAFMQEMGMALEGYRRSDTQSYEGGIDDWDGVVYYIFNANTLHRAADRKASISKS
jgi:hypothetical protein